MCLPYKLIRRWFATRELLIKDPNYADAAVLALGAFYLDQAEELTDTLDIPARTKEGWIMGQ
jgi:hypothetical protein